ncbi:MAG: tetratricopeptide repeat protein [Bacteroidales bacterium]|nr:tetratricopeptide repeat protein [Bacteroidales bacterium]
MKIVRLFLISILLTFTLIQCSPDPKAKIQSLEEKMGAADFTLDDTGMKIADELIQAYLSYEEKHKDSPEAPDYLYKAADLSLNINKSKQSLDLYNRIIYQYPDYKKVPECLFLMGYIYENYFQELGKAKEIYESFLAKYPNHDFADDAKVSIENLGKSPEELIRSFEEKNKLSQDSLSL